MLITSIIYSQKKVQTLSPARIGVFKNGTCFVKREGLVNVLEKNFYIKAPDKVLMGTYWVMVGKESSLHSIIIKTDTFKVVHAAKYMSDYLETNIGQIVTLYFNNNNSETKKINGKLIEFSSETIVAKIVTTNGKTVIVDARDLDWLETTSTTPNNMIVDSIISVAKVKLTKPVDKILASTISLERGTQWFPSYLFTIINDKEAKLELKATIANGATEYLNMPVDIIIGNPEMFYGNKLDPVCIDYLAESLLEGKYDNNGSFNLSMANYSQSNNANYEDKNYEWKDEEGEKTVKKEGQKLEDLYYYQLGVFDLEKNSRTIVPVMNTIITYSEIYSVDISSNLNFIEEENKIQTYHSYLVNNNGAAPLTTGPALVVNQNGQPLSQAKLSYTPSKGTSEMQLSKAIDVQVKNEEIENDREKSSVKKANNIYYEKVSNAGNILITNYKEKKIKIRVTKSITGVFVSASNNGISKKGKTGNDLYWEIEIEAGAKQILNYEYHTLQ